MMTTKKTIKLSVSFLAVLCIILFATVAFSGLYQSGQDFYKQMKLFHAIMKTIHENYVDEKSPDELIEHAIEGVISELDPHTNFMTAKEYKDWNKRFEGYSGIGIFFDVLNDKITILSVIKGGPSERMGLMPGDQIIEIDSQSAIGIKRDDVPLKLMGPRGTKVDVLVERKGLKEPLPYTLERDVIHLQSVPFSFMIKPGIGYILVNRFASTTPNEFVKAFLQLESQGLKSLIVDFRNNGGGYMEAAVDISDLFLPGGKRIVFTKGRIQESYREFFSTSRITQKAYPIIVLQNRTSASASEIVAGALQDWDRGLIVGETSFGKGLVQSQFRYADGSALMITTAKYHTPSGRVIQRPYDNKSLEEYYRQAIDDEGRAQSKKDTSIKVFHTQVLNREVTSNGGITPDIFFKSQNDTLSHKLRGLVFSAKRPIFSFVQQKINREKFKKMGLETFINTYEPDDVLIKQFHEFVSKEGIKIDPAIIHQEKSALQFLLKQQIAATIWDDEASYRVQLLQDHQLSEALTYFPQAKELLKKAYPKM